MLDIPRCGKTATGTSKTSANFVETRMRLTYYELVKSSGSSDRLDSRLPQDIGHGREIYYREAQNQSNALAAIMAKGLQKRLSPWQVPRLAYSAGMAAARWCSKPTSVRFPQW